MPVKKKGKKSAGTGKRKKKLSAAEKAKNKIEKETDKLKRSEGFWPFVERTHDWLLENQNVLMKLLSEVDTSEDESVDYGTFKACLLDLLVPCSRVEIHLLLQTYDPEDTGRIFYVNVKNGMNCIRGRDDSVPQDMRSDAMKPTVARVPWDGECYTVQYPKYVEVTARSITFDKMLEHPTHVTLVLPLHITTYELCHKIAEKTQITTSTLHVFMDKERTQRLPLTRTLEEQGFRGGPREHPVELYIFYDYKTDFWECPLLMCDHYFGQKLVKSTDILKHEPTEEVASTPKNTSAELYYS